MLRRKETLFIACSAAAAVLTLGYGLDRIVNSRTYQTAGKLIARMSVPPSEPLIALTFDDGPASESVHRLLPMLAAYDAHATFFVEGRVLERDLGLGRELLAAGHELGNHSYSHQRMVFKSQDFIASEIERTDVAIRKAGQHGAIHFRPPFGKKLFGLPWYLAQHERTTVMWDVEPDSHPQLTTAAALADHVVQRARPGSIVLLHVMHESRRASLQAVPGILSKLSVRGFHFVTISELMAQGQLSP